ncbi:MAG: SDR family NAD(P)-dependent oxidoreductase [Anaerolineae bacterium]|jgi:NAD(P)-dependent dehydrogenase (short-subunit alcohol dehydrogenase family)
MQLEGKVAIITGGASGIGRATALLFAREGASVAVVDVHRAGAGVVSEQIVSAGGQAIAIGCDVGQAVECRRAVEQTTNALGGPDILFNNVGIIRRTTVLDITEEEWDRVMAINVRSIFLMSKYAIPFMIRRGGGAIVNTGSGWGLTCGSNAVSYCASKGAVVNMTRAMAIDHGAQNIRVNCICPGDTDTDMLRSEARQLGVAEETFLRDAADRPLQRVGTPQEIAQAVLYLASDAASFVTGSVLVVDGGGLAG